MVKRSWFRVMPQPVSACFCGTYEYRFLFYPDPFFLSTFNRIKWEEKTDALDIDETFIFVADAYYVAGKIVRGLIGR